MVLAPVALARGDEFQGAVAMLLVVPLFESGYPLTRLIQSVEGFVRKAGMILHGLEQRLGIRIVVTDRGATEGGNDAEPLQGCQHGRSFHRSAVVGMQPQQLTGNPFAQVRFTENAGGMLGRFLGEDLPSDDLAAVQVHDQVEIEIQALHRGAQVGDIPAPELIGGGGHQLRGARVGRHFGFAPVSQLFLLAQDPVKARLRGQIAALVGEFGHNLVGRQMGELRCIGGRQDLGPLRLGEFVRRHPTLRRRFTPIGFHPSALSPALHGSGRKIENLAGFGQACAGSTTLTEQGDHFLALLEVDFSSSVSPQSA